MSATFVVQDEVILLIDTENYSLVADADTPNDIKESDFGNALMELRNHMILSVSVSPGSLSKVSILQGFSSVVARSIFHYRNNPKEFHIKMINLLKDTVVIANLSGHVMNEVDTFSFCWIAERFYPHTWEEYYALEKVWRKNDENSLRDGCSPFEVWNNFCDVEKMINSKFSYFGISEKMKFKKQLDLGLEYIIMMKNIGILEESLVNSKMPVEIVAELLQEN